MIGTVFRAPNRDANGDPIGADGNVIRITSDGANLGMLSGLIFGTPQSDQPVATRGNVVDTQGLVGAPIDAPITLQHGDVLAVNGVRYAITGPRLWGDVGYFGMQPTHYWITCTATVN
jgi:hypothetical protein